MTEHIPKQDNDIKGWQQAVENTSQHPELQAIAIGHLERAKATYEISPEHHQSHTDIARPTVPNIDNLPPEEQDYIGEIIEIGEEALEDAGVGTTGAIDMREAKDQSMTDAEKIKQNLENYFSSKTLARHIETAARGDFELKSEFIGDIVQYGVLFPEATYDDINNYAYAQSVNYLQNRGVNDSHRRDSQKTSYITNEVARTLDIAPEQIEEHKEDIARYIYDHCETNGFIFHGFNSAAEASIKQHGLSGNRREWDNNDIGEINAIFAKYGVNNIAGWHAINSEGAYFVSNTPSNSYSYAARSPEWFSSFTGGSLQYSHLRKDDGRAFSRRDREAARRTIQALMSEVNMEVSEREHVLNFFDKHWDLLAEDTKPMIALVERSAIGYVSGDFASAYKRETTTWDGKPETNTAAEIVQGFLDQHAVYDDRQIRRTAPPEAITIITLPR